MSRISKDKFNRDREIQRDIKNTESNKQNFIEEIKNGLGEQIKNNPNVFKKLVKPKKTIIQKFIDAIKDIFKTL